MDTITAKFKGICKVCKQEYTAGSVVAKVAGTKKKWTYAHCDCAAKPAPVPPPPAPEPTPMQKAATETFAPHATPNNLTELRTLIAALQEQVNDHSHDFNVDISDDLKPIQEKLASLETSLAALAKRPATNGGPLQISINKADPVKFDKETVHECFVDVLTLASIGKPVLLVGPSGSGKTHIGEQVAKALKRKFGFISCTAGMSEGQLTGRLLPVGKGGAFEFVTTEFVECYEKGGVFLLDEVDAADSNTLLIINSALANGLLALPNRPDKPQAKRHENFVLIAAANTFGTGANRQYVGRSQLDEATLDRFRIATLNVNYDESLEAILCPDDQLRSMLQDARARMMQLSIRRIISTRFLKDAYHLKKAASWDDAKILSALTAGWTADEVSRVFKR